MQDVQPFQYPLLNTGPSGLCTVLLGYTVYILENKCRNTLCDCDCSRPKTKAFSSAFSSGTLRRKNCSFLMSNLF